MQMDFHYYATYCAAFLAGYDHEESMDIAYSAQFVDCCTRTLLSKLKAPLSAATTQLQLEMMNARTDLVGLQDITRIWASFHFLPGDLREKVEPYLRPLYDAFFELLSPEKFYHYTEKNVIEVAPLAYMRGRTLNDSFIILDEAQNTTPEQMKMFLTRIGFGSRAVVTGDLTQVDLPNGRHSGLKVVQDILKNIEGISFVHLQNEDVVRHEIVQRVVAAYEEYEKAHQLIRGEK